MITLSPDRHTAEYNRLKERIAELKRKAEQKEPLYATIVELHKDADDLETLYIQDMRNASIQITRQADEYQKRHQALIKRLTLAETQLQAIQLETHGFGTFLRHVG